jgi:eukaryotic-like serine/threonine-protein kinase
MQFWNELEGQTIDGVYPMRRLVRSEGRIAWFETETGDGKPATISLTEALTDGDEVHERLQAAQNIKHPNLVSIQKVGHVTVDGTLLIYAVMEHIEQSLSDVLQEQALTAEEGREVAEALVGALGAIHQAGMSHGRVEAASILATETTVKLRSDCLHTSTALQEEDIAAIGPTLFHTFTQRKGLSVTDAQINRVPAPFAEIIRNSFARRWSLAQISNALKPALPPAPPTPPPAPPAPPAPKPATPPVAAAPRPPAAQAPPPAPRPEAPRPAPVASAAAATAAAAAPAPAPRPAAPKPAPRPTAPPAPTPAPLPEARTLPFDAEDEEPAEKKKPMLLYLGIAFVVLALFGWLLFRPHSQPAPATAGNTPPASTPAPAVTAPAVPSKPSASRPSASRPSSAAAKPAAAPKVAAAPAATSASSGDSPDQRKVWRVVAYTYRGQSKAQDMVDQIKSKHPNLDAEVFSPGKTGSYLVTIGGPLDRDAAVKMRDQAQRMGLPADTYIQNFKH